TGLYATIVSLARQLLVLLPAAYLLSLSGRLEMVWWSFPIAEIASVMVTSVLMLRIYRQKLRPLVEEQKALGV
ncbi:MAG: MATE family efflux transporter, partial [Christensenellales bacterium]